MKIGGNVLMDKNGSFAHVKPHDAQHAICGFASMVETADYCKDSLYYEGEEWEDFYARGYSKDEFWEEAGQIAYTILFVRSSPIFINNQDEYNARPEPKISGGFEYEGCPENYVYDKDSIETWHDNWLYNHPERIDWGEFRHNIWPRYDRTIAILREELEKNKEKLEKEKIEIPKTDEALVNVFHDYIMNHKSEVERISYAKDIGAKICKANYYHRETELEKLEGDHGNNRAEVIYSMKKDGKYIFLSVDKQHGMLELCDDKGDHQMEIRFDGTKNKDREVDHSLKCVKEWKKIYKNK